MNGLSIVGITPEKFSEKVVGINTEGASINMGKKSGAVKKWIDEVKIYKGDHSEDYLTVVHCIAHNLELAVCDSNKKQCIYLNKFEEVLKGIFHFYYYSPKKRRELFEITLNLDKDLKRNTLEVFIQLDGWQVSIEHL